MHFPLYTITQNHRQSFVLISDLFTFLLHALRSKIYKAVNNYCTFGSVIFFNTHSKSGWKEIASEAR
jgi:hypothetical protein